MPTILLIAIVAWGLLATVICLSVCMAAARFNRRDEPRDTGEPARGQAASIPKEAQPLPSKLERQARVAASRPWRP